jgi:hypothetical protein
VSSGASRNSQQPLRSGRCSQRQSGRSSRPAGRHVAGAGRRPTRAAAGIPASVWQEDAIPNYWQKRRGGQPGEHHRAGHPGGGAVDHQMPTWRRAMDEEMASLLANNMDFGEDAAGHLSRSP